MKDCNVVWNSTSKNSSESMPVGGGDMGLNVWVENNELLVYIARAGCRDENGALLKLGRVRVQLDPDPFKENGFFRQELKLQEGFVEIQTGADQTVTCAIRVWTEIHRPVAHIDIESQYDISAIADYETWRHQDTILPQGENKHGPRGMCKINFDQYPGEVRLRHDEIEPEDDGVMFYHRNGADNIFDFQVRQQNLEEIRDKLSDPLTNLIFGGKMTSNDLELVTSTEGTYAETPFKGWRYRSKFSAKQHHLQICSHIVQTDNLADWKQELQKVVQASAPSREEAWQKNLDWWKQFWERSWIVINSDKAGTDDPGWKAGRNYNLFRYMLASNLNGCEPSLFNGGLFTFDPLYANGKSGPGYTPDHRQWGAALTAQNQRLLYWPMLKTGDFDLMSPGFDFYKNGLINAGEKVRHYWAHKGCCFAEQTAITALPGSGQYGFLEGGPRGRSADLEDGVGVSKATGMVHESQLEWAWMILRYYRFAGSDISQYLPFIEQSVIFYDEHYQMRRRKLKGASLDENGKLEIYPSNTLEAHPDCKNPASVISGLRTVLKELLELPEEYESSEKKQYWQAVLQRLPELPVDEIEGRQIVKPAENYWHRSWHMPEMYPLYPYQEYGLGKDNLELMKNTFCYGVCQEHRNDYRAWTQGLIHYARLGITEEAKELAVKKLDNGPHRFPAFWPEDIDWVPDHNWGGCGMVGLQEMLMQTHDDKIRLLPAWPEDWDVDFKLHAPQQTVVQGKVRSGKITYRQVTPENRTQDVIMENTNGTC